MKWLRKKITLDDKVLIVTDNKSTLDLIGTYIDSFGYEYDIAHDDEEAIKKLRDGDFTIVLTDIVMPGMEGMQLLKEHNAEIGAIVVTWYSSPSYTVLIKARASHSISKPFSFDELEAKLKRLIRELKAVRLQRLSTG